MARTALKDIAKTSLTWRSSPCGSEDKRFYMRCTRQQDFRGVGGVREDQGALGERQGVGIVLFITRTKCQQYL